MKQKSINRNKLPDAIEQLVAQFGGEKELLRAAINASYFLHPNLVTLAPLYPTHARHSRKHYDKKTRGDTVEVGGKKIILDFNHKAQDTWKKKSNGFLKRKSGYGVRHIWGRAWDPEAFTAPWNLCYMPFWAGMLTEDQHPFPELARVIQQISFNLYFKNGQIEIHQRPAYIKDLGINLDVDLPDETLINLVLPHENDG